MNVNGLIRPGSEAIYTNNNVTYHQVIQEGLVHWLYTIPKTKVFISFTVQQVGVLECSLYINGQIKQVQKVDARADEKLIYN